MSAQKSSSPRKRSKLRVLFVCLGNACRSPMAEAVANQSFGDSLAATSAGLFPLGYLPDLTQSTLTGNGYLLDGLHSKPVTPEALADADVIVNMSGHPRENAFDDPSKVLDWSVVDPYGGSPALYQRILDDIRARIAQLVAERAPSGNQPA